MRRIRSRSIVRTLQRASRGVKALFAVVTLLTSVMGAFQTFSPLARELFGILPPVPCQRPSEAFKVAISSDKYQYIVGENVSLYYYVNSNAMLKILARKPDGTQVSAGTFAAKAAGTYRVVLGSVWYPTGTRTLIAEASSGSSVAQAMSYYVVVEQYAPDLAPSEAGAKNVKDTFYNSSFQLVTLDADDSIQGEDREVTRFPGQSISISISYKLWNTWNMSADQVWQVVLVYSWAESWPPTSEYQVLYSGLPGRYPVPISSGHFNVTAPLAPGTYYAWIIVCPSKTTAEAISNLETPPSLPAHLRIIVKPRLSSNLFLTVPGSAAPWGSSAGISGRLEPPINGANITLCYSHSQAADSQLLGHVVTNPAGQFSSEWAPPSLGNYVIVAEWSGSEEFDSATSMPVPLAITFPWINVTIIAMLFCVGILTTYHLVRTPIHERHATQEKKSRVGRARRKIDQFSLRV